MLGKLLYEYKRRYGHGARVAWYRDVVRPQILRSQPVVAADASVCEIHVLTSANDWMNLMWALKSFYVSSGRKYALCIHDDGSLTQATVDTLRTHFPAARIIGREQSDREVPAGLAGYPRSLKFRETNALSAKVFDFRTYLASERMLLLDSDVLFFREPTELLTRIESFGFSKNSVNADTASAYTVSPDVVRKKCGVDLIPCFNSGLGLIHRQSIRLDWIEEFLGLPGIHSHFWRIEQTLYALCSSRFGVELLPAPYSVFLDGALGDRPVRHYVGSIRHLMYGEGLRRLIRSKDRQAFR